MCGFFQAETDETAYLAYAKLWHINIDNPTHILAYARPLIGQYMHITNTLNQNQKGQKGRFMENQIFAAIWFGSFWDYAPAYNLLRIPLRIIRSASDYLILSIDQPAV